MGQQAMYSTARLALCPVRDRVGLPQVDPVSRSAVGSEPAAPWMEDAALEVWVDLDHSPIVVRHRTRLQMPARVRSL